MPDILLSPWVALGLAYLAGSIPSAYIAGRVKGIDLRTVGSGNLGATNVLRTLGWRYAAPVFLVDFLKGWWPAYVLPFFIETQHSDLWAIAYGAAAIGGHAKPIFLLGRGGGKGVATGAGVFAGLAPIAWLVCTASFIAVVKVTGYVSLGSLIAAVVLVVGVALTLGVATPVFAAACLICAFVWWTHRANIGRLRRGEEHSFKKPATPMPPATDAAP